MTNGIYVHFPFCRKKCDYCAFYSVPIDSAVHYEAQYTAALKKEITGRYQAPRKDADSIYFGGGTPSLFHAEKLSEVLETISKTFNVLPQAEISIELNPADISAEKLNGLKQAGFNRFVLGVQTLDPALHALIGRTGEPCGKKHLDEFFSCSAVTHCLDLIIGIPGQNDLETELEIIASYGAKHISAYLLSIEEKTPLEAKIQCDEAFENMQRSAFINTKRILESFGYRHYEISNYALSEYESLHNKKYWTFQPYISFGSGAHSFYDGRRYINKAPLEKYMADPFANFDEDKRGAFSAMTEFVMTGLRMIDGFSTLDFTNQFGELPQELSRRIDEEIKKGMLVFQNGRVSFSEKGLLFADRVIFDMVQDLL